MMESLLRPIAIVAHDAGAANHIFSWIGNDSPILYLTGPARALWRAHHQRSGQAACSESEPSIAQDWVELSSPESKLATALSGVATVITGTGWQSSLEHDARKVARERRIRSIAVIDHWVNYADRFVRNGEEVLPDEIWVSDDYAAAIARVTFPGVSVTQQANTYLAGLVAEVEALKVEAPVGGNDRVLYLLEPIRKAWGTLEMPGEILALDYFLMHRQCTPISRDAEIRLRLHPSDPPGKYDEWITRQTHHRVSLDKSTNLAESIAWSNVVVGCQSYAMTVALACGRTVISSIPSWAPSCALPHKGIFKLSEMVTGDLKR
jgi:hypothetical protein